MKTVKTKTAAIVVLLILFVSNFVWAAEGKDSKAEKVLNDYVEAVGGPNALAQLKNLVSESELVFIESGLTLKRKIVETPNQYYIKVTSQQTGDIVRVFDGAVCKEMRMGDVREILGEEKQSFLNTSAFLRYAEWENTLADYQYEGLLKVDGTKMHKLAVTTVYGQKESWYFEAKSKLLTKIEEELDMPGGKSTATTVFSDYREVNKVKTSFEQTIRMPGQNRKISYSKILANQDVDSSLFKL